MYGKTPGSQWRCWHVEEHSPPRAAGRKPTFRTLTRQRPSSNHSNSLMNLEIFRQIQAARSRPSLRPWRASTAPSVGSAVAWTTTKYVTLTPAELAGPLGKRKEECLIRPRSVASSKPGPVAPQFVSGHCPDGPVAFNLSLGLAGKDAEPLGNAIQHNSQMVARPETRARRVDLDLAARSAYPGLLQH